MICYTEFETVLGRMVVCANGKYITGIYLEGDKNFVDVPINWKRDDTHPILTKAHEQIIEFLAGRLRYFDLPLKMEGTVFQRSVWNQLTEIPYGETATYQDVAEKSGYPKAFRAVGTAVGRNPLCLIVPCHRVVAKNGIGGYASGVDKKIKILAIESESREV